MRTGSAFVLLSLLFLAAAGAAGCCDEELRKYAVDAPDASLSALVEACRTAGNDTPACADVCKRVMTIAGDSADELELCIVDPGSAAGAAITVTVTFCS